MNTQPYSGVFRYFLPRDAPSPGSIAASLSPYANAAEDDSGNPPSEQLLLVQTTKVSPSYVYKTLYQLYGLESLCKTGVPV